MRTSVSNVMRRLGLPLNLIGLIRSGELVKAVEAAFAELDALNASIDAWEAANPEAARRALWYEGREAWKRAGRPQPPWYELLHLARVAPITEPQLREARGNTGVIYKRRARAAAQNAAKP